MNCTAVNKTTVILTWEPPVLLAGDGIIRGYNINYTDSRYREFYLYKTKDASIATAVIDNLEPATMYYFQASSRTRKTFGGGGAVVMCQTKADGSRILLSAFQVFFSHIHVFCFRVIKSNVNKQYVGLFLTNFFLSFVTAPTAPRNVQLELSRIEPPQLTMRWIPSLHTYGPLKNYTLHWGVKNGALRKELIDPTRLRWISDFLGNLSN